MLASALATLFLVSSVIAAPSPRPGQHTNRQSVASRITNKANYGVARRQAASARIYPTCADSPLAAGQGVAFAVYNANINFEGNGIAISPGTSQTDCTNQCAIASTCRAVLFVDDDEGVCISYTAFSSLDPSDVTVSFKSDCASLAATYPAISNLDCCNYFAQLV